MVDPQRKNDRDHFFVVIASCGSGSSLPGISLNPQGIILVRVQAAQRALAITAIVPVQAEKHIQ
jgi:hypothetical protein